MRLWKPEDGPWWSNTPWGRRKDTVSIALVVVLLLLVVWKTYFP
jgi:hypothetical protein